ncbi:CPCC family cysteine-rich protein [Bacillus sp. JJ664]|uniref:Membrane protein n=1 Tax=Gottfriedia solisilvae TaxID=1516104 RepID=A0A8J3AEY0_9BACI|nr:CPCC family cysteine-rich protein [Gottfriedia solisilvae]GGI11603.1 membrane protein [Gottfriedia solisilvae]
MKKHTCPCCGYKSLTERNEYESCQVCMWMDDDIQEDKPYTSRGANQETLVEAQKNFIEIGRASKTLFPSHIPPLTKYEKDKNWKPLD